MSDEDDVLPYMGMEKRMLSTFFPIMDTRVGM